MSRITNVLLLVSHVPPDALAPFLARIERWEVRNGWNYPLVSFADAKLPAGWCGGDAGLSAAVAIGALNHLELEPYLAFLRSLPWASLGRRVQLALKEQDDDEFRLFPIFPLARAEPHAERELALADLAARLPVLAPEGASFLAPPLDEAQLEVLDDAVLRYMASRGLSAVPPR